LETEHDNLRIALEGCLTDPGREEGGLRLAATLARFWVARGHYTEGRSWLKRTLDRCGDAPPIWRARALNGAGRLAWFQSGFASARLLLEEALTMYRECGDQRGAATTLNSLGFIVMMQGEYAVAFAYGEESVAILRKLSLEDNADLIDSLITLAILA